MRPHLAHSFKDVVLIGAGHAHVGVLRMFGMTPDPAIRLTLITREVETPYSGMLPGLIAGHYDFDAAHIDTGPLCQFAGARLYQDEVLGIDRTGRRLLCRHRPPVPYDVLSIDIGSVPGTAGAPGATDYAIPVKPIDGFLARFERARARILAADGRSHIVVVGGGAGGVELMLALHRRLSHDTAVAGHAAGQLRFTLVSGSEHLLPAFPVKVRRRFAALFRERGIDTVCGGKIVGVEAGAVEILGRGRLAYDELFWATAAAPAGWLTETGLALDRAGFVRVLPTLQSISDPRVFAAGDVAAIEGTRLPRSGVYAVRAGRSLAINIRRVVAGKKPLEFRPQREALYLVSTGEKRAIGTRNGLMAEGGWVWHMKDWIDRRFMDKFNRLPDMQGIPPAAKGHAADGASGAFKEPTMRCGGCGAKIGADVLSRVLGGIEPIARADVIAGLGAADDAAIVDTGGTQLSVQTVDYFRAIVDDPYTFGRIAANHALGDIYAMGAEPQSALAIATIAHAPEAKVEQELSALLAGANEVLREAGCALVGGHTSEGVELALGFAITGLVARGAALHKGGLQAGDVLILTKSLGTGTLLAAHMRGRAKARWVMGAIAHMTTSNARAAAILREHGAHAATDVTGFGLLGHLAEMVRASAADARVALADIPVLEGATETIGLGIVSSLHPQNMGAGAIIRNRAEAISATMFALLIDPQTAGGLLAGVPGDRAASCVEALRAAGYARAAIIGSVGPRDQAVGTIVVDIG